MVAAERRDLVTFLRTLTPAEWEHPSLCEGWRVRDVVGHLLYDATPPRDYLAGVVRGRLSVDGTNAWHVDAARTLSTDELASRLESSVGTGLLATTMPRAALGDLLVHHQDIRRGLGRAREIPAERLRCVLAHPDPFAFTWRHTRGLRFVATDLDWASGRGPEVRGAGEALVLGMAGRHAVLAELDGEGVGILRRRIGG